MLQAKIVHLKQLPPEIPLAYFQQLLEADTLKYRFSDIDNPTIGDVKNVIKRMGQFMFFTMDDNGTPNAEFMFDTFLGKTAQVHFSMLPSNPSALSIQLASSATDTVLSQWGVAALWGLTPVPNRAARLFNIKAGFKPVTTLPQSVTYFGELVDAILTMKKPAEVQHG